MQSSPNSGATWVTFLPSSNYERHRRFRGIAYLPVLDVPAMRIGGVLVLAKLLLWRPIPHREINCESSGPLMA
jgi:hypothetical protein